MNAKHASTLLALALLLAPSLSSADDRGRYRSGSIRHRPTPPPRPIPRPPVRPGLEAQIRHDVRQEVRREIRSARRERALFLGGLAVLGAITRSLPPQHTTVVVQGATYFQADGTWFVASGGQYRCVAPPFGAVVTVIPSGAYVVPWGGVSYHYFNGAFYAPGPGGYRVVAAPPGVIVPGLPEGYVQQGTGYAYGGVSYREVIGPDGEPGYQVVGPQ